MAHLLLKLLLRNCQAMKGPATGPMDLDNETTHLLDEMSIQAVGTTTSSGLAVEERGPLMADLPSQAIETCSTAPVPIQAGRTKAEGPTKTRRGSAGLNMPGPSTSGQRTVPETIQEEPDVSPETSKADRDTVFPDKGLEGALFGEIGSRNDWERQSCVTRRSGG
jgi:hypothetical protein